MDTRHPRSQILNSPTKNCTSKQAWPFSNQNRFTTKLTNCPYVSYSNLSTMANRKQRFGKQTRKVFTETNEGLCSQVYQPRDKNQTVSNSFGEGRDEVIANSYILREPLQNLGPGKQTPVNRTTQGFSLRPKIINHRNYFVEDKEMVGVLGPGSYHNDSSKILTGNSNSKYRSVTLGNSMTSKSKRFDFHHSKTPSSWDYNKETNNYFMGKNSGAKIGSQARSSFTDKVARSSFTPGPGNYREITEFGHFGKINWIDRLKR